MQIGPNFNTQNYRANNANLKRTANSQPQVSFGMAGKAAKPAQKTGGGFFSGLKKMKKDWDDYVARNVEVTRQENARNAQLAKEGKLTYIKY